jgi:negative regulator of flagellin synthesis FlgM
MTVEKVSSQHMPNTGPVRDKASVERASLKPDGAAPETARTQEDVEISPRAKELARIRALVAQMPDPRSDRVDEIKQKVASGTYQVPAIEVAKKMLEI